MSIARLIPPAAASFIASGLGFALSLRRGTGPAQFMPGLPGAPPVLAAEDLTQLLLRPGNWVLWALTLLVWIGIGWHALSLRAEPRDAARKAHLAPLLGALVAGAIWPWTTRSHPLIALGTALAMAGFGLIAVIRSGYASRDSSGRDSLALAGFAGWAMVAACAALAGWLSAGAGLAALPAAMLALMAGTLIGMGTQMRLGRASSYSMAIIWAMLGIAVTAMTYQPGLAITAALGMTAMSAVLVRAAG